MTTPMMSPMTTPMRSKRLLATSVAALLLAAAPLLAQRPQDVTSFHLDADHDGLEDALEQRLLEQFEPHFLIGERDCSNVPAEFTPGIGRPEVERENGTIYGQVSPVKSADGNSSMVEIHYYHLWGKDCGKHGHPFDTEHVAVLIRPSGADLFHATWKALYWYAAAHEDTVCDVSQITRAATLEAEDHGAAVWISPGKHASYLNPQLCGRGCGADRCEHMVPLESASLINLGEPMHPMNGSLFISSKAWPLQSKMSISNFPSAPIERLNQLPNTDIAWFNAGQHPVQGVIAKSSATEEALAGSGRNTTAAIASSERSSGIALSVASDSAGESLSSAGGSTNNALQRSFQNTRRSLGTSARHIGEALRLKKKPAAPSAP